MDEIPITSFFYIPHKQSSLITSLRSITSSFLLYQKIYSYSSIYLLTLKDKNKKIIEIKENNNKDLFYVEHPLSFKLLFKDGEWNYKIWDSWLKESILLLNYYPDIKTKFENFYKNEIIPTLGISFYQVKYLKDKVTGLDESMILPFLQYQYRLKGKTMKELNQIDWNSMLGGHVDAMTILYNQILSKEKRETIVLLIFKITKILYPRLEKIYHIPKKMETLVLDFKREVNKVIQNEVNFVSTNKILFREWFLSLSQFSLYIYPIKFNIKESILKLNLILYLGFHIDEVYQSKYIYYNDKQIDYKKMDELKEIHPFMRNIYTIH